MCHSCDSELNERFTLRHYVLFIKSNLQQVTIKRIVNGRFTKIKSRFSSVKTSGLIYFMADNSSRAISIL